MLYFCAGSNVTAAFEAQRHAEPRGPLVRINQFSYEYKDTGWQSYTKLHYYNNTNAFYSYCAFLKPKVLHGVIITMTAI